MVHGTAGHTEVLHTSLMVVLYNMIPLHLDMCNRGRPCRIQSLWASSGGAVIEVLRLVSDTPDPHCGSKAGRGVGKQDTDIQ